MEGKEALRQLAEHYKEFNAEEKRIRELSELIESMKPNERAVTDVVTKGKKGKKPLGICKISGTRDNTAINRHRAKLRERKGKKETHLSQVESAIIDAEEYIYTLEDSEIRSILLYFCIDRLSWNEVAKEMGDGYTAEACKQKYSRFMRVK